MEASRIMKSLQGEFLVASPHLPDPNFYRTVVLMIQHDAEGAFGVVLNRPGERTVAEIWEAVGEEPTDCPQPVYLGGPVEGPLLALHRCQDCSQCEILPGLFMATDKDHLRRIVNLPEDFRIFCGYSGWGPGQLESELEIGGWLTSPASVDDIFLPGEEMWKQISGRIGLEILGSTIGRQPVPEEPWLN
jgi:putative transcriptional regulator